VGQLRGQLLELVEERNNEKKDALRRHRPRKWRVPVFPRVLERYARRIPTTEVKGARVSTGARAVCSERECSGKEREEAGHL
jgi:hypothetical protein